MKEFFVKWISLLVGLLALSACVASLPVDLETPQAQPRIGAAVTSTPPTIDDRRLVTPILTLASTPTPYPLLAPTAQAMKFISATIPCRRVKPAQITSNGQMIFVSGQQEPVTENVTLDAIFGYNLQDKTMSPVVYSIHGPEGAICCLEASKNWVVWLDYIRYFADWKLFAKNLNDGVNILISQQADTNVVTPPNFAISGDNLIWTARKRLDNGDIKNSIMRYELSSGTSESLAESTSPEGIGDVDIDDNSVVWVRYSPSKNQTLVLYNLNTRQSTQIIENSYVKQPQIGGDYLVWLHPWRDVRNIIVIRNLKTGYTARLPDTGAHLRLGNNLLLWDNRKGTMMYDIEKNAITNIFLASDKDHISYINIWQRQIVLLTGHKTSGGTSECDFIEERNYLN